MVQEIKNPCILPLVFPERLVIHEQIDHVAVSVDLVNPTGEFLRSQRPFPPTSVRKAKGNVIAEPVILEQKGYVIGVGGAIKVIRRTIAENLIHALADNPAETQLLDEMGQIVVKNQLCIAEDLRPLTEKTLDSLLMQSYLLGKLVTRV